MQYIVGYNISDALHFKFSLLIKKLPIQMNYSLPFMPLLKNKP